MELPLDKLKLNQPANLISIKDNRLAIKIQELGLFPGDEIKIIIKSPLGCPLILAFDETQITMRASDANNMLVNTL